MQATTTTVVVPLKATKRPDSSHGAASSHLLLEFCLGSVSFVNMVQEDQKCLC